MICGHWFLPVFTLCFLLLLFLACVHIMCCCFWPVFTLCLFFFACVHIMCIPFQPHSPLSPVWGLGYWHGGKSWQQRGHDVWSVSFLFDDSVRHIWAVGHSCIDRVSCNLSASCVSSVSHSCIASTSCDDFSVGGSHKHRNNPACTESFSSTANWSISSFSPASPPGTLLVTWPCLLQGYITHLGVLTSHWVCLPLTK